MYSSPLFWRSGPCRLTASYDLIATLVESAKIARIVKHVDLLINAFLDVNSIARMEFSRDEKRAIGVDELDSRLAGSTLEQYWFEVYTYYFQTAPSVRCRRLAPPPMVNPLIISTSHPEPFNENECMKHRKDCLAAESEEHRNRFKIIFLWALS